MFSLDGQLRITLLQMIRLSKLFSAVFPNPSRKIGMLEVIKFDIKTNNYFDNIVTNE